MHPGQSAWTLAQPSAERQQIATTALVELYRGGLVEPGALLWREGMDRWLPPYDIPEIAAALKEEGLSVPGSELDPGFEEEEEATRVALSPLRSQSAGIPNAGISSPSVPSPSVPSPSVPSPSVRDDDSSFGDDEEITRAIDSSTLAASMSAAADGEEADEEEATRIFDSPLQSAAPSPPQHAEQEEETQHAEQEEEATRVYESAADNSAPSAPAAGPRPSERIDAALLGSATPPPEELAPRFQASSILSVPPPDETSDVSGIEEDPFLPVQRTTVSWRPAPQAPVKRSRAGFFAAAALVIAVGVLLWQRPDLVERLRTFVGSAAAPETPHDTDPPFDTERVGVVLEEAALAAQRCKLPGGPVGYGRVHVRYTNSGRAESAQVSEPFVDTEVGECLTALFTATRVPPFSGKAVIVAKNFTVE